MQIISTHGLTQSDVPFLRRVEDKNDLSRRYLPDGCQLQLCSVPLKGDFDKAALRLATLFPDMRLKLPMDERKGGGRLFVADLLTNWRLLLARYTPYGSMGMAERQAFDAIINDLDWAKQYMNADVATLRVIYSNGGSVERGFHKDFDGRLRLLRAYNISAMQCLSRTDCNRSNPAKNAFTPNNDARIYGLEIGDYAMFEMEEIHCDPNLNNALIHRAPEKTSGGVPRLLLCCDN